MTTASDYNCWMLSVFRLLVLHLAVALAALITHSRGAAAEGPAGAEPARANAPERSSLTEAVPDEAWEAVFNRSEGWLGGDAIYSAPLPGGDLLWLFADSILGTSRDGRRVAPLQMVNNAVARHRLPSPGAMPAPEDVKFFWGSAPGAAPAVSWIVPDAAAIVPANEASEKSWYWVGDAVVVPGPAGAERLIVFLWRTMSTGESGVFSFRTTGNAMAVMDRPSEPTSAWRPRQVAITHTSSDAAAGTSAEQTAGERSGPKASLEFVWGSEALIVEEQGGEPMVLVYGYRQEGDKPLAMILARVSAAAIDDMSAWRFRTADGWSSHVGDAAPVAVDITTEFSVTRYEREGELLWALVHSEPNLGERIMARTAPSPEGPFSAPRPIYRVPAIDREKKHFPYAGKAHAELARRGELLVTYVVNSFDFGESLTNAAIYRPRFVRVPVSVLPRPPGDEN